MTRAQELAELVTHARFDELSRDARDALRLRILDSLGCAYGALDAEPIRARHDAELNAAERVQRAFWRLG